MLIRPFLSSTFLLLAYSRYLALSCTAFPCKIRSLVLACSKHSLNYLPIWWLSFPAELKTFDSGRFWPEE
jgi:hypothetical protein